MRILFTKSDTILSKLIRNVTEEPISHCALEFNFSSCYRYVVHSNIKGLHKEPLCSFKETSEVVFALERKENNFFQDVNDFWKLQRLLEKYPKAPYDFGAFLFLGASLFLRDRLNLPLPKSNLWQSSGMFLCTEWVSEFVNEKDDSMVTPYQLYLEIKDTGEWQDSII